MNQCMNDSCERGVWARGRCRSHYRKWARSRRPEEASYVRGGDFLERMTGRVCTDPATGCWEWIGARHTQGYGFTRLDGKQVYAHRASYMYFVGPIPEGMFVLHSCDNPPCVNPEHLRVGDHQDNMNDKVARGRARNGATR